MSLPILQVQQSQATEADLVRLFHRTDALWVQHLAEAEQLAVGTAYLNPSLPNVWDANHVRDAALSDGLTARQAYDGVTTHYAARRVRCAFWVMNPSAPSAQTQPLIDQLLATGHGVHREAIFYLRHQPRRDASDAPGLKIIPARASYRHSRELAEELVVEVAHGDPQVMEARLQHLDDPHYDVLLALRDGRAVGTVGVFAAGELAQIQEVYVSPTARRQGVAKTLMTRALEACARAQFRHVFLTVLPDNVAAKALYAGFGFEKLADVTHYRAPASAT